MAILYNKLEQKQSLDQMDYDDSLLTIMKNFIVSFNGVKTEISSKYFK